jgi:flagellar protein FliL
MADSAPIPIAPPKSKRKLILIVALLLVVVGGGAGTVAVLKMKSAAPSGKDATKEAHVVEVEPGMVSLEPFVTNLAGGDGDRYIKCTVRIEFEHHDEAEKIKASEIAITRLRDRILTVLAGQHFDAVVTAEGKEQLRAEIHKQVEGAVEGAKILEIYYTEFLVQ